MSSSATGHRRLRPARAAAGCALLLAALGGLHAVPAHAQEAAVEATTPPVRPSSNWQFKIIPYAWFLGIKGDVDIGSHQVQIDKSFADLISNANLAGMLHFETWWKRRWGFYIDPSFFKATTEVRKGRFEVDSLLVLTEAAALFRPWEGPVPGIRSMWFDVKVGVRHVFLRGELERPRGEDPETSHNWVDPIVGARLGVQLIKALSLQLGGDVGGFKVGTNFTWNAVALLDYQFTDLVGVLVGYRVLGFDADKGRTDSRLAYDITQHGPLLGFSFTF